MMIGSIDHCRDAVDAARREGSAKLAEALVILAEREPALGSRTAVVRAHLDAAAGCLNELSNGTLRARVLLRLAYIQMIEQDYEGAEQALTRVGDHAPDDIALRFLAGVRACRVTLRRGDRNGAARLLARAAQYLDEVTRDEPGWRALAAEVALGIAEIAAHDDEPSPDATAALADLVRGLSDDEQWADVVFTGRQLLATAYIARGELDRAVRQLRSVIKLAVAFAAPADEIEARLALAGILVERGDATSLAEASRLTQVARDRALEHGLDELHMAALIGQAGVLANRGRTAGAVDRCLEIAQSAVATGDVSRYLAAVGLMANIYQRAGDFASAYRTIAEAYHGLQAVTDQDVEPLFRPHLASLHDRLGAERFAQLVDDVNRARRMAGALEAQE